MTEQGGTGKKAGWGALGHQWITAIAALITALTGAGFFIGRASVPSGGVQPAPVTTTVTVRAPSGDGPVALPSSSKVQPDADPNVYYSGPFTWGTANMDLSPPAATGSGDIQAIGADDLYTTGGSVLKVWADSGTPGKDDCKNLALSEGTSEASKLHPGSLVCGVTVKGRPFRLTVSVAGSNGIITDVTVWNK
ncbi:hypothetical protein [Amycolatopsis sp. PS_44_ISF1]|uniref:hypothetical protein n=1 Tax=Amycolatopsis sp. PS_44_ISF1 TaxID=2974917 RepID=UPI0028DEC74E|nr:hypothetical protein [Amycolatopsis sp. PS_44_ISF1]MDT8910783.1 hypothetical protein [Amycolatopsis sp. PS_44_ISF1]